MILTLDTGREIWLEKLNQFGTYAGLLVGNPTPVDNDRCVNRVSKGAATEFYSDRPTFVIPPVRTRLAHLATRTPTPSDPSTHYERLGWVTCIGRFFSEPISGSDADRSCLIVVWWQDEFAFPLESGVEAAFKSLDWDVHAWDWSF